MIGNSQGETEIPLDCYLSWMSTPFFYLLVVLSAFA